MTMNKLNASFVLMNKEHMSQSPAFISCIVRDALLGLILVLFVDSQLKRFNEWIDYLLFFDGPKF